MVKLPVPLHRFDKEVFTKRNKTREMNVVGDRDQNTEACWDFTPLQFHLRHRQVITQSKDDYSNHCVMGLHYLSLCSCSISWSDKQQNCLITWPFSRWTSSLTWRWKSCHNLHAMPCPLAQVWALQQVSIVDWAEEKHCVPENQIVSPVFLALLCSDLRKPQCIRTREWKLSCVLERASFHRKGQNGRK